MKTFLPYFRKVKLLSHTQESILWECKTVGKKNTIDEDLKVVKSGFSFMGVENIARELHEEESKIARRIRKSMRNYRNKKNNDKTIAELNSAVGLSGRLGK